MGDFTVNIEKQLTKLGKDIQDFVERVVPLEDQGQDFVPVCDIIESADTFVIRMDLPGLSKKEINIALKEQVLTVRGERVVELNEDESFKRQERKAGVFSRSFALPQSVDTTETDALFRNGVLKITMPKTGETGDSTSIPIK